MSDLKKYLEQKKTAEKKVADAITKDTKTLHEKIAHIADATEQNKEQVVALIQMAISLTEATGKSLHELLNIDEPKSVDTTKKAKGSSAWTDYKRTHNGKKAQYPGGEPFTIRLKGQNNAEAEAAFHAKTLELL